MATAAQFGWDPASRTLAVTGELDDAAAIEQLVTALGVAGDERARRIDLSGVTFLPSSAVSILVRAGLGRGARLEVVAAPGTVAHRILTLVALPVVEA